MHHKFANSLLLKHNILEVQYNQDFVINWYIIYFGTLLHPFVIDSCSLKYKLNSIVSLKCDTILSKLIIHYIRKLKQHTMYATTISAARCIAISTHVLHYVRGHATRHGLTWINLNFINLFSEQWNITATKYKTSIFSLFYYLLLFYYFYYILLFYYLIMYYFFIIYLFIYLSV